MLEVGAEFDRYRIEAELGAGGMGKVFRAFDTRLQRRVALKVLLFDSLIGTASHADASARLIREARAAAAFEHPSKVSVFDVGSYEGSPFIAMELVSGRPLRAFIGADTPLATRLGWLVEVARVLSAAHAMGLVHRDIKPENVMIRDDGGVKVLDFGIARRTEQAADGHAETLAASISTLTGAGVSLGTPLYMAPEQIRAEKLDGRVDQFAWGTMAHELLSGRHPWGAGRDMAGAIAAIVSLAPPELPAELGSQLTATLNRTLAKAPEQRFASFDDVLTALQAAPTLLGAGATLVIDRRESAAPTPFPEALGVTTKGGVAASMPAEAPTKSPRRLIGFALAAALALALAAGGWLTLGRKPAAPALEPRAGLATLERYRDVKGSDASSFESANLWQAAAQDFELATRDPQAPARWRAARAFTEGKLALASNNETEALKKLREAVAIDPEWAIARTALCSARARVGKLDEALAEAAKAQQLEPDWWGGPAASAAANAYANKLDQAIEDYRRALVLSPDRPLLLANLALVYHASRLDSEAERLAKRALELDPELVAPRLMLAERALERSDGGTALAEATRALAVLPQSVPARLAQGDALVLLKREAEANDAYRRALQVWEAMGRGGPFGPRLQALETALAAGTHPASPPLSSARSAIAQPKPAAAPRSPVIKKPGAAPGGDMGY